MTKQEVIRELSRQNKILWVWGMAVTLLLVGMFGLVLLEALNGN